MNTSRKISFKCKFDEQMLGFAEKLIGDDEVKRKFSDSDFADDVVIENIRGADDETIVEAATFAERTIITNDVDYFFTTLNKYGTIVLRGSVHREDGTKYPFHRLTRDDKQRVIRELFLNHVVEMQSIREGRRTELALLSGKCKILKLPGGKKYKTIFSRIDWHFRVATEAERRQFMIDKLKKKSPRGSLTNDSFRSCRSKRRTTSR